MKVSIFTELHFFELIIFSFIMPAGIYIYLMRKRTISRNSVLVFAISLIVMAGIDVFLLQRLSILAKNSPTAAGNVIFASEVSVALYLLPALLAGVGMNMISHLLISHLVNAEKQYDLQREHGNAVPRVLDSSASPDAPRRATSF